MVKTPAENRMEKNRDHILDVAVRLILENGFENFSLREIARHADYSPAALYRYFDNKAAISTAVLQRENARLIEVLSGLEKGEDAFSRLVDLCMAYIRFNLDNPVYTILLNNLHGGRTTFDQPVPAGSPYAVLARAAAAWITEDGAQMKTTPAVDVLSYWAWSLIHGMATLQLGQLRGFDADFVKVDRTGIELLLRGVLQNGQH